MSCFRKFFGGGRGGFDLPGLDTVMGKNYVVGHTYFKVFPLEQGFPYNSKNIFIGITCDYHFFIVLIMYN